MNRKDAPARRDTNRTFAERLDAVQWSSIFDTRLATDTGMSCLGMRLYLAILALDGWQGYVKLRTREAADYYHVSAQTIRTRLRELERRGYIEAHLQKPYWVVHARAWKLGGV